MCTPILIAAAALEVGSTVANVMSQNAQTSARNDVLAAERIRQHGFDQQAAALNNQSRERYAGFVPQQTAEAANLSNMFATTVAPDPNTTTGTVLPSSTSNVVNQEVAKKQGEAQQFVDQQGHALADMKSFGDLLGEISGKQARDASQVGQINGFKQGSEGIVPLELQNAQSAGDGWSLLGSILGGVGSVATSAGVNGGTLDLSKLFGGGTAAPVPMPTPSWLLPRASATPLLAVT